MESWARYRNIATLVVAIVAQLILLGYQVRRDDDMTLLRAWVVGAVTPVNRLMHGGYSMVASGWTNYFWLIGARNENETLKRDLDRIRLENAELRRDVQRYQRQQRLVSVQNSIASQTLIADVIGGGASSTSKEILVNKGRSDGVLPGMAALTADGIVGRVQASYPNAALVMLIHDVDSGVGVLLGGSRVRGVLKGQGGAECLLDYVDHEVDVEVGEAVYTSGDDRIYPKGLRVGEVTSVEKGPDFLEISVRPYAALDRLDEILIVVTGVHEELPAPRPQLSQSLLPLPGPDAATGLSPNFEGPPTPEQAQVLRAPGMTTEADRLVEHYRSVVDSMGVRVGENERYTRAPDFNQGAVPQGPQVVEAPFLPDQDPEAAQPAEGTGQEVEP
ncbi:MAG: rod shape-determining protein MreC [Acidobacteria bacterium]|nr:rod shape-determining protein MreC [Acidobacteriota bacterium]